MSWQIELYKEGFIGEKKVFLGEKLASATRGAQARPCSPKSVKPPTDYTWERSNDGYFSLDNFHVSSLTRTEAPEQDESETYPAGPLQIAEGLISFRFYRSKSSNIVYIPVRKTEVSSHR